MERRYPWTGWPAWTGIPDQLSYFATILGGIPGFFRPTSGGFFGPTCRSGSIAPDFIRRRRYAKRLKGLSTSSTSMRRAAADRWPGNVRTSMMRYFDSREMPLCLDHIMASGALPPAFPAVRIEGEHSWDGGIFSNTPTEVIFDDNPRRSSLIFAVHLWNPVGPVPTNILEVLNRHKDVQYSSRIASHVARQQQAHGLRHVINQLVQNVPTNRAIATRLRNSPAMGARPRCTLCDCWRRGSTPSVTRKMSIFRRRESACAGMQATRLRSARSRKHRGRGISIL